MHRFPPVSCFIHSFLLLAGVACAALHADGIDYENDKVLVRTTVDIGAFRMRGATLDEIISLVEAQTDLRFIYVPSQLPLDAAMSFEAGERITLARLFLTVSAMLDVVFLRHEARIVIRAQRERSHTLAHPLFHGEFFPALMPDHPSSLHA